MEDIELKKKIMKRVYTIFILRKIFRPVMYRLYLFAAFLGGIVSLVSISNVLTNMPADSFAELYSFALYAFAHTELLVQALTLGLLATTLWWISALVQTTLRVPRLSSI
jgi:hypothetical protein